MLKIRLQRVGRKHEPTFRLVLTESTNSTKSGRFKEILGSYDARKATDLLKTDRIKYWLEKGVKTTGTVHNLLLSHKVIDGKKVNVLPKKTYVAPVVEKAPEPEAAPTPEAAPAAEETAPAVEEAPVAEAPVEVAPEATEAPIDTVEPVVESAPEAAAE